MNCALLFAHLTGRAWSGALGARLMLWIIGTNITGRAF